MGLKPDRFEFHETNAEILFQGIQTDILVSFISKDICFISKRKQIKGYPIEIRTLEDTYRIYRIDVRVIATGTPVLNCISDPSDLDN